MATTIKPVKVPKNASPLEAGQIISGNALGLFNQALEQIKASSNLLEQHALSAEAEAEATLREAEMYAEHLKAEAATARDALAKNQTVHKNISNLLAV